MGMKRKTRNLLRGVGSILNIMPAPRKHVSLRKLPQSPEQITAQAWEMVGDSFRQAMGEIRRETTLVIGQGLQGRNVGQKTNDES